MSKGDKERGWRKELEREKGLKDRVLRREAEHKVRPGCAGRFWGRIDDDCFMMPFWRFLGKNILVFGLALLLIGDLLLANKIRSIYADVDVTPHVLARKVNYP